MKKRNADFNSGFTLVELLVVIAIIAVLISLLAPSLSKAREGAKMIDCASRMRQVYLLGMTYREDNKQFYPACHFYKATTPTPDPSDFGVVAFATGIYPYLPQGMNTIFSYGSRPRTNLLFCPNSIYAPTPLTAANVQPWVYAGNGVIVGYNTTMQFGGGNYAGWTGVNKAAQMTQYGMKKELITQKYPIAWLSELAGNSPYLFYTSAGPIKYNHYEGKSVNVTMSDGVVRAFHEDLNTAMARPTSDNLRLNIW